MSPPGEPPPAFPVPITTAALADLAADAAAAAAILAAQAERDPPEVSLDTAVALSELTQEVAAQLALLADVARRTDEAYAELLGGEPGDG